MIAFHKISGCDCLNGLETLRFNLPRLTHPKAPCQDKKPALLDGKTLREDCLKLMMQYPLASVPTVRRSTLDCYWLSQKALLRTYSFPTLLTNVMCRGTLLP